MSTLKCTRVNGTYEDGETAHDLKRTVAAMLRDGVPPSAGR
ncbi:hypothetical protein [Methanoculleus receptaculi]|jgi:hypothetical protein|uniref:Uncharacterized protein n=1 Tax=Methanoculleus receptaculi TaxID=394967 RepID=A0AAX4FV60_9EURY|nr:hypothetical protein [Methanoculleus receptaculi]WOX57031.1 hypothetical protein R6Y96_06870 [Methanoculleus receptaculi]